MAPEFGIGDRVYVRSAHDRAAEEIRGSAGRVIHWMHVSNAGMVEFTHGPAAGKTSVAVAEDLVHID